jgi:hypothetical protein
MFLVEIGVNGATKLSSQPERPWAFGPPEGMTTASAQQLLFSEAPPSPLSSRPKRSAVEGPAVAFRIRGSLTLSLGHEVFF